MLTVSKEAIEVIANIIDNELTLETGQVVIYNQKYNLPADQGLHITVGYLSTKVIANNNYPVDATVDMNETQQVAVNHQVQIDCMSAGPLARLAAIEILMALNSVYAQRLCEQYNIRISRIPSQFNDTSILEASAILNRFTLTITVDALYSRTKTLSDYNTTFLAPEVHHNG